MTDIMHNKKFHCKLTKFNKLLWIKIILIMKKITIKIKMNNLVNFLVVVELF